MHQPSTVNIERENAWSPFKVTVKFGKHVASSTCKCEESVRRFVGKQMRMAMEKYVAARGHAYASTGRFTFARLEKVQRLRYRLSADGKWDAKRAAQVFMRSAGDFQQLLPPTTSRLRESSEELFNDLSSYSRQILSQP